MKNAFQRLLTAAAELRPADARNQSVLARFLGESPQTLTNWKSRGIVPKDKVLHISRLIGCDPYWLESGRGEMVAARQQSPHQANGIYDVDLSAGYHLETRVPVYTWAEIREIKNMQKEQHGKREYIATPVMSVQKGAFALKVEQAQFKTIPAGSFVVFQPGGEWIDGAIAIFRKAGSLIMRRMRSDGDLRLLVAHDDAPWQTEQYDAKRDEIFATKEVTMLIDKG